MVVSHGLAFSTMVVKVWPAARNNNWSKCKKRGTSLLGREQECEGGGSDNERPPPVGKKQPLFHQDQGMKEGKRPWREAAEAVVQR